MHLIDSVSKFKARGPHLLWILGPDSSISYLDPWVIDMNCKPKVRPICGLSWFLMHRHKLNMLHYKHTSCVRAHDLGASSCLE